MLNRIGWIGMALAAAALAGCKKGDVSAPSAGKLTPAEMAARFPADLGPATIEVSKYPEKMRQVYPYFLAVCSTCHSPARAINAPYASRGDWERFVHRMHVRYQSQGYFLDSHFEKDIVDFLVYDSRVRKLEKPAQFRAQRDELTRVFQEMMKRREQLLLEETKKLPKKESPYVGVK